MDLLIISAILILGFVFVIYYINQKLKPSNELMDIINMLQASSKEDRKVLLDSLHRNTVSLNQRLDQASEVIAGVKKDVGEMSEIGRSMRDLQAFLQSPKLRGNVGEQVLKELLSQMLPKQSFHLQYSFKSGEKVDAAIQTSAGIIPIDSKFPMENFNKLNNAAEADTRKKYKKLFTTDVKKHISDISKKYILTEEGTIDYALMYVPSEAVYYEIVNSSSLFEYSSSKRVLPVSPTTFYAYMRAILMSFEGQKIEKRAQEILSSLRAIQKDYEKVDENMSVLQKHLTNATNMMNNAMLAFSKLGQKIEGTSSLGSSIDEEKMIEEE